MEVMLIIWTFVVFFNRMYGSMTCNIFKDRISISEVFDNVIDVTTSDLTDCVVACSQHELCTAITFNKVSETCKWHDEFMKSNHQNDTVQNGWIAMMKEETACTNYGRKCMEAKFNYSNTLSLCYKIMNEVEQYDVAVSNCQSRGGGLLRVDTAEKESYMEYAISKIQNPAIKYYIDAKSNGSVWQFSNGEEIRNFYWYPGANYENKDCIGIHSTKHGWKDIFCTGLHGYICELQ